MNGIPKLNSLFRRVLTIIITFLTVSCSSGNFAGGTSTETTNGVVILTSTGMRASEAFVSVVDGSGWLDSIDRDRSPVVEEGFASESGWVYLRETKGTRTVRVVYGDQSAIASGDQDTIWLSKSVSLHGTAYGTDSVRIGGTDLVAPVENGSFRFESVPMGLITLYKQSFSGVENGTVIQTRDTAVSHDLINASSDILFDDFAGGFDLNPIHPITEGVSWYTFCDSIHKSYHNGVWIKDSLSYHNGNSTISAQSNSKTATLQILLGTATTYPYAGLGARLGNRTKGFDLSRLSRISLRIRGTGTVRFRFGSAMTDSLEIAGYSFAIPLDQNWKTVTIPVDSLHLDPKDSLIELANPWRSGSADIRRMEFLYRGTENAINSVNSCEIDEIWFDRLK